MSVSSPATRRHEVQSPTATTRLPDNAAVQEDEQFERWAWEDLEPAPSSLTGSVDDDQPQQSICESLEPSTSPTAGSSYKTDYVLMAAVCAIIVFLWMQ